MYANGIFRKYLHYIVSQTFFKNIFQFVLSEKVKTGKNGRVN